VLEDHFAGDVASGYDDAPGPMGSAEVVASTVEVLAGLAGDGAALELAVGTGRIPLPLAGAQLTSLTPYRSRFPSGST
jgi:hypothetical protein